MKFKLLFFVLSLLLLTSCLKHDLPYSNQVNKERIDENVNKVFGTKFDVNHDWCTTSAGKVIIKDIPSGTEKIQLLAYISEEDGETSILVLNEIEPVKSSVELSYDIPSANLGLYVVLITNGNYVFKKVTDNTVSFTNNAGTLRRAISTDYVLPSGEFSIENIEDSYSNIRGWVNGEKLYQMNDYSSQKISVADFSDEYKEIFRSVIFSYFKNGRKYNNLPLIKESGYYNENVYPITTGDDPIFVSPVYKNDGGYQEIINSDLYYYYFKENELGDNPVEYLEKLPKYKAFPFNECIMDDDVICKHTTYALIYWGDGIPEIGTVGSYQFPEGYKIGFIIRAKTTAENGKKQGELYGDGRLNNHINKYGNFKSSKLGEDGPRMGWLTVNNKMMLCCESGTDTDFNDIILEIEGGVEPIINIPEIEYNYYTFCFEDTEFGDYDMNDVVIKARRLNSTQVEYSVVACGAYDKLTIMGINGNTIKNNVEVHSMFGVSGGFINTVSGQSYSPITDIVNVNSSFSFLDETTQPYIYDITTGKTIKLSRKGEDPHGIMIPYDFRYPLEKVCVKNAYLKFNSWGENRVESTDWFKYPVENLVF
jgi:hypothetical protein